MKARALLSALATAHALFACSSTRTTKGFDEPLRVRFADGSDAQFVPGPLPGTPALSGEELQDGGVPLNPSVQATLSGYVVSPGQTSKPFSGDATETSVAVGVRFDDLGSGYWVFPVGAPDVLLPGQYTWRAAIDFSWELPPGNHPLSFAALDAAGNAGTHDTKQLCVDSLVPDNLNACNPKKAPPQAVITLSWDRPSDLDLQVLTPSGKLVDPKHPSTVLEGDAGVVATPLPASAGAFDTDSGRGCVDDGRHRENLVWQQKPEVGRYYVYVNLFDACGQQAVHFDLSLNQAVAGADAGLEKLTQTYERAGELLAADANGGAQIGLFVTELVVN